MTQVIVKLVDDWRIVYWKGYELDRFNIISDDFAYTNSNEAVEKYKKMREIEFQELYPEFFI